MKIDKKIIKELTDYLNEFNLTEIEYTEKDTKIKVSKSYSSNPNQSIIVEKTSNQETSTNLSSVVGISGKQITS